MTDTDMTHEMVKRQLQCLGKRQGEEYHRLNTVLDARHMRMVRACVCACVRACLKTELKPLNERANERTNQTNHRISRLLPPLK